MAFCEATHNLRIITDYGSHKIIKKFNKKLQEVQVTGYVNCYEVQYR